MSDIFIIFALIILNGVFSMSEIAVISARKSRLEAEARRGSKGAKAALKLGNDPDRFLSTIQIGITLIGILTGLYSGATLASDAGALLTSLGLKPRLAHTIARIVIVTVVTYLSIVVGELVPKRIGLACSGTMARLVSRPMRLLSYVAMPAVWLLSVTTSGLVKLLGIRADENAVTEDEIKSMIRDGASTGEVRKVEQDIMERALVMGDLRVSSIMTPKIDITGLCMGMDASEILKVLDADLHNSYPVFCDAAMKTVCGIVSLKHLILSIGKPSFELSQVIEKAEYFPETMSVYDALDRMKQKSIHFVLVCDEFGDVTGVITPGDILDSLVGAMQDPDRKSEIMKNDDGSVSADAQYLFYDFLSYFGLESLYSPAAYTTLGGFMLEHLKHMPERGEQLLWNNILFEVADVDGARIRRINVCLPDNSEERPSGE